MAHLGAGDTEPVLARLMRQPAGGVQLGAGGRATHPIAQPRGMVNLNE